MVSRQKIYMGVFLLIVFAALFAYISIFVTSRLQALSSSGSAEGPLSLSATVSNAKFLEYNESRFITPYALLHYSISNAKNVSVSISAYNSSPGSGIFLLDSSGSCYECLGQQSLLYSLASSLAQYGIVTAQQKLSLVKLQDLPSLPQNSILIVSSGLIPYALIQQGVNSTLANLLANHDAIIYVGYGFNMSLSQNDTIFATQQGALDSLSQLGLTSVALPNSGKLNSTTFLFNSPKFALTGSSSLDGVDYLSVHSGSFVMFGNYPSSAWKNASDEASDLAKAIWLRLWMQRRAYSQYYLQPEANMSGSFGAMASSSSFSAPVAGNATSLEYILVRIMASNSTSFTAKSFVLSIPYGLSGFIKIPPVIGQGQTASAEMGIRYGAGIAQQVNSALDIYNSTGGFATSIPLGNINSLDNISIIKYYLFALQSGAYTAVLRDTSNRVYANAAFFITPVNITASLLDYKNNTFTFAISSAGKPVERAFFNVSLDGAYPYSGNVSNGTARYSLPAGSVISYGNMTFDFRMFGEAYAYSASHNKTVFTIPVFYIEYGVVALVVALLNVIAKPPERDEYYIDVQELPPKEKAKVKLKKSEIASVFDRANATYRWKYMPLSTEEIKTAVSNTLRYNNMPIAITTQNAIRLLNGLVVSNDLLNSGNYYAPKSYADGANHDIEYLAIFRQLRDKCIAKAIVASELNASPDADAVISKSGAKAYVMIYSKVSGLRPMRISSDSKSFIVFKDGDTLEDFREDLYLAYGDHAEMLKMGIAYGYLRLASVDEIADVAF